MASLETDPTSLAAGERLRRAFPAELAAQALTQVSLRRRAKGKFPHADQMFLTPDGVEQATRGEVARWRASKYARAGVQEVWDLGCGLGVDAMAFEAEGISVQGIEADAATAAFATANLALVGGKPVLQARAEDVEVPEDAAVFLDPARRTARGRSWNVADLSPSWEVVSSYLTGERFCCVKLGPGFPKRLIPDQVGATWVSVGGGVVEVSLWNRVEPGYSAAVFPRGEVTPAVLRQPSEPRELPVKELGAYVLEPDNAVIRAGLVREIAPGLEMWLLSEQIAYLSCDDVPPKTPFAERFKVLEVLPFDIATIRRYVKQHRLGTLEIKCRGIDIDPAQFRRKLHPKGSGSATIILSRGKERSVAIIAVRA